MCFLTWQSGFNLYPVTALRRLFTVYRGAWSFKGRFVEESIKLRILTEKGLFDLQVEMEREQFQLSAPEAALEEGHDHAEAEMDILDRYKAAPLDIQEEVIHALGEDKSSHWTYDKKTRAITVESLHALRHDVDSDQQLAHIVMAVWIGAASKLVVETRYTTNISHWGYKYYDIQQELTDPTVKQWLLEYIPKDFPVEFVYNPIPLDLD
ncbi:hypothetical protein R1sor_004504 [Riccia sorocarpa]|uniref:Uncharacterized protein n=1 Tax=Riccia sorocarpa TaxID=122646 RepID=A0ABD3HHH8_9MARC